MVNRTRAADPRRSRAVSAPGRPATFRIPPRTQPPTETGAEPACDSPVPRRERLAARPEPILTSRMAQFEPAQRVGDVDRADRDLPSNALWGGVRRPSEALAAERRSQDRPAADWRQVASDETQLALECRSAPALRTGVSGQDPQHRRREEGQFLLDGDRRNRGPRPADGRDRVAAVDGRCPVHNAKGPPPG